MLQMQFAQYLYACREVAAESSIWIQFYALSAIFANFILAVAECFSALLMPSIKGEMQKGRKK